MYWFRKQTPVRKRLNQLLYEGISSTIAGAVLLGASLYIYGAMQNPLAVGSTQTIDILAIAFWGCVLGGLFLIMTGVSVIYPTLKLRELLQPQLVKEQQELAKKAK